MPMLQRRTLLAGGALALPCIATAQPSWPTRPVTLIVPVAPGGSVDILGRVLADGLAPRIGQPVVVENRSAAGGIAAMETVRAAAPDGHTLIMGFTGQFVWVPHMPGAARYDPIADFTPIAGTATFTNALVVRRDSPFRTPAEIVEAARTRADPLTYSSGGVGTSHHFALALFAQKSGVRLTHVPYRGAPQGITAVMTGEVDIGCYNIPTVLGQIRAGELRALAVTARTPSPLLPGIAPLSTLGWPDYEMTVWQIVFGPARLPAGLGARIRAAITAVMADAALWRRLEPQGFEPMPPEDEAAIAARIGRELAFWAPVVRDAVQAVQ